MIEVTLRITGVDLDAETTETVIATKFPETVWEEADGLTTLTVFVDRKDAVAGVIEMLRQMETALEGFKVVGVSRGLVGVTDIALRAGVSREGARKWSIASGFPAPFDYVGAGSMKVWAWTEIVDWLKSARGIDLNQELPTVQMMTQIENCIMRNPDHTSVQWHQVVTKSPPVQPVFQTIQPAVRISAGGRAQRDASEAYVLVGAVANTNGMKLERH